MRNAFIIAGLIGAGTIWADHPAGASVCGCHIHSGVWRCAPSFTYCASECRDTSKVYPDRASCLKGRNQSEKPVRKTTQSKKKPG